MWSVRGEVCSANTLLLLLERLGGFCSYRARFLEEQLFLWKRVLVVGYYLFSLSLFHQLDQYFCYLIFQPHRNESTTYRRSHQSRLDDMYILMTLRPHFHHRERVRSHHTIISLVYPFRTNLRSSFLWKIVFVIRSGICYSFSLIVTHFFVCFNPTSTVSPLNTHKASRRQNIRVLDTLNALFGVGYKRRE